MSEQKRFPEKQRFKVMFVCIGNSCRSPMAEGFARDRHSDIIEASSSGIGPAPEVPGQRLGKLALRKADPQPDQASQRHTKRADQTKEHTKAPAHGLSFAVA